MRCLIGPDRTGGVPAWLWMRNRADRLIADPEGRGVACDWEDTRSLHVCDVFPSTGGGLMRRALRDCPIILKDVPDHVTPDQVCWNGLEGVNSAPRAPAVSFLIGHRGEERAPHLLTSLRAIAGQEGVSFECIVVEQDGPGRIQDRLPAWVRYIHTPPEEGMPYCRAWTLNVAARAARGRILICHDHDLLVPERYARSITDRMVSPVLCVQAKRFVFYLDEPSSRRIFRTGDMGRAAACGEVVQNLECGGSLAVDREAFFAIGGFDEAFRSWGGEDNDFWDRCRTLPVDRYGFLPLVHLWHRPQPGKQGGSPAGQALLARRRALSLPERIARLKRQAFGRVDRPADDDGFPEEATACAVSADI
jgi:hypothetical protein